MNELYGDLFAYYKRPGYKLCITTNGFIKKNGEGVMGAGCAKEAAKLEPSLPALLGAALEHYGNVVTQLTHEFLSFPVKHNWFNDAEMALINTSANALKELALQQPDTKFILPRPGCGNGNLDWKYIKLLLESVGFPNNVYIIAPLEERPKNE